MESILALIRNLSPADRERVMRELERDGTQPVPKPERVHDIWIDHKYATDFIENVPQSIIALKSIDKTHVILTTDDLRSAIFTMQQSAYGDGDDLIHPESKKIPLCNEVYIMRRLRINRPTDIRIISLDIETYNHITPGVPSVDDVNSVISMICATSYDIKYNVTEKAAFVYNPCMEFDSLAGVEGLRIAEYGTQAELSTAFIRYVRDVSNDHMTILTGFNIGATRFNNDLSLLTCGYDLPHIIKHAVSRGRITPQYAYLRANGTLYRAISMLNILGPRVFVHDAMIACANIADELSRVTGRLMQGRRGLDQYAEYFGLEGKMHLNVSYAAMQEIMRLRCEINGVTIRQVIEYCIRDTETVVDIYRSQNYIARRINYIEMLNLPIQYAFTISDAAASAISQAITENFNLKLADRESTPYRGALTFSIPHEGRNIILYDYASLYPSCILAARIDKDNYIGTYNLPITEDHAREIANGAFICIPSSNDDCLSIGNTKLTPAESSDRDQYMLFRNQTTRKLIAMQNKLKLRLLYKKRGITPDSSPNANTLDEEIRQCGGSVPQSADQAALYSYSLKIALNSEYGLLGSNTSFTASIESARACTLLARRAITTAARHAIEGGGNVFLIDTDSIAVEHPMFIDARSRNELETAAARFQDMLNNAIRRDLGVFNVDSSHFNIVNDGMFSDFITLPVRKSYIKRDYNAECIALKGVQLKGVSHVASELTYNIIESIIKSQPHERQERMIEFILSTTQKIQLNPSDFARIIKLHSKSPACVSLSRRIPELTSSLMDHIETIIVKSQSKSRSDALYPTADICTKLSIPVRDDIDAFAMFMNAFSNNLTKFLGSVFIDAIESIHPSGAGPKTFMRESIISPLYKLSFRTEKLRNGVVMRSHVKFGSIDAIQKSSMQRNRATHEIITQSTNRLVFDIDGDHVRDNIDAIIGSIAMILSHIASDQVPPLILAANDQHKRSYHVIYPITIELDHNRIIAEGLHNKYPEVDKGIYSIGHSLRCPLSPKITTEGISQRVFQIMGNNTTLAWYSDALITNITDRLGNPLPHITSLWSIELDRVVQPICDISDKIDSDIESQVYAKLCMPANSLIFKRYATPMSQGYNISRRPGFSNQKCTLCDKVHQNAPSVAIMISHKRILIRCLAKREWLTLTSRSSVGVSRRDMISKIIDHPLQRIAYADTKYIRDVEMASKSFLSIRADMGCGKTYQIRRIVAQMPPNGSIIAISPRITFAQSMSKLYAFESYQNIQSSIDIEAHPRLMLQIDSISRLSFITRDSIQLLILDEIESILAQLSIRAKRMPCIMAMFISILKRSERIIIADALLSDATISMISRLAPNLTHSHIEHLFRTMEDHNVRFTLLPSNNLCARELIEMRIRKSIAKMRNIVFISEYREYAEQVIARLRAEGFECCLFTGEGMDMHDGKSMYRIKHEAMTDINAYINKRKPRVLAYTSTLQAGISIECPLFDEIIAMFSNRSSHLNAIQMIGRVRAIRHRKHHTFIIMEREQHVQTMEDAVYDLCDSPAFASIEIQLQGFISQRSSNTIQKLITHYKRCGANISLSPKIQSYTRESIESAALAKRAAALEKWSHTLLREHVDAFIAEGARSKPLHELIFPANTACVRKKYALAKFIARHEIGDDIIKAVNDTEYDNGTLILRNMSQIAAHRQFIYEIDEGLPKNRLDIMIEIANKAYRMQNIDLDAAFAQVSQQIYEMRGAEKSARLMNIIDANAINITKPLKKQRLITLLKYMHDFIGKHANKRADDAEMLVDFSSLMADKQTKSILRSAFGIQIRQMNPVRALKRICEEPIFATIIQISDNILIRTH